MNDFSNFLCLITEPREIFGSQWTLQKNGIAKKNLGYPNLAKWCGFQGKFARRMSKIDENC